MIMRILQCTFEPPSKRSGGGLGIYQSGKSLCSFADVDYIGPEFGNDITGLTYREKYFITSRKQPLTIIKNLLFSIPTSFYDSWKHVMEDIDIQKYDAIFLDFSRYDFVVKKALENNIPIYIRLHNVEQDYYGRLYEENKSVYSWIKKTKIKKWEKYCIKNANAVICLTTDDKDRLLELYPKAISLDHLSIVPVCIDQESTMHEHEFGSKYKILLTGSLWYGFNAEGAVWFLEKVWPLIVDENIELVIAGARPNSEIKSRVEKSKGVTLIDTPEDMTPYFETADVYVAPIFDGAGMKVKVAEALSYGLPVVGTKHAFIGYEDIPLSFFCETEKEFACEINRILQLSINERYLISQKCIKIFEYNNSMTRSINEMRKILEKGYL